MRRIYYITLVCYFIALVLMKELNSVTRNLCGIGMPKKISINVSKNIESLEN